MLQEGVDVVPEGLKALLCVFYPLLLGKVLGQVQLSQELLQWSQVFFTLRRSQVREGGLRGGEEGLADGPDCSLSWLWVVAQLHGLSHPSSILSVTGQVMDSGGSLLIPPRLVVGTGFQDSPLQF